MEKDKLSDEKMKELVDKISQTYKGDSGINFIDASNLPAREKILQILDLLTKTELSYQVPMSRKE